MFLRIFHLGTIISLIDILEKVLYCMKGSTNLNIYVSLESFEQVLVIRYNILIIDPVWIHFSYSSLIFWILTLYQSCCITIFFWKSSWADSFILTNSVRVIQAWTVYHKFKDQFMQLLLFLRIRNLSRDNHVDFPY